MLIKISFKFILASVPLLLLFTCIVPAYLPSFLAKLSLGLIILVLVVWLIRKEWLDDTIRLALFIAIPFVIYFSEVNPVTWIPRPVFFIYNIWGAFIVFFVVLTMKLTRRNNGLKATPLHFLILLIALIIPNLPDTAIKDFHLGMVVAKIIFFFFGFEVLIGELRNKMNWLGLVTLFSFVVLAAKISWGL